MGRGWVGWDGMARSGAGQAMLVRAGLVILILLLSTTSVVDAMIRMWRAATAGCRQVVVIGSARHRLFASSTALPPPPAAKKQRAAKLPSIASITEDAARAELVALDAEINRHDALYYEDDRPELTDAAYDKLVRRADALAGKYSHLRGLVKKLDGKVGSGRRSNKFPAFQHSRPMLSLDNAFSEEDLGKFVARAAKDVAPPRLGGDNDAEPVAASATAAATAPAAEVWGDLAFVVEPKIDGMSLAVRYVGGQLVAAGTRGDGTTGEEVTAR